MVSAPAKTSLLPNCAQDVTSRLLLCLLRLTELMKLRARINPFLLGMRTRAGQRTTCRVCSRLLSCRSLGSDLGHQLNSKRFACGALLLALKSFKSILFHVFCFNNKKSNRCRALSVVQKEVRAKRASITSGAGLELNGNV